MLKDLMRNGKETADYVTLEIFTDSMLAAMKDEFIAKINMINKNIIHVEFRNDQFNVIIEKIK